MKIGTRVYSSHEQYEGFGTIVEDRFGLAGSRGIQETCVDLDDKKNTSCYWYLNANKIQAVQFAVGDRVAMTTDDSFDGSVGTVVEILPFESCIDYAVKIDGRLNPVTFEDNELGPIQPKPRRRLTVKRNIATSSMGASAYVNDGSRTEIIEGEFDIEIEDIDPHSYVQVDYSCGQGYGPPTLYTYVDPTGGSLNVGDTVEVPVLYGTKVGTVAKVGRGAWTGACKTVAARIVREAL